MALSEKLNPLVGAPELPLLVKRRFGGLKAFYRAQRAFIVEEDEDLALGGNAMLRLADGYDTFPDIVYQAVPSSSSSSASAVASSVAASTPSISAWRNSSAPDSLNDSFMLNPFKLNEQVIFCHLR